jgi:hypothetical protein
VASVDTEMDLKDPQVFHQFLGLLYQLKIYMLAVRQPDQRNLSGFHQKEGQLVEQHAHKIHSYSPSNLSLSSGD